MIIYVTLLNDRVIYYERPTPKSVWFRYRGPVNITEEFNSYIDRVKSGELHGFIYDRVKGKVESYRKTGDMVLSKVDEES